VCNSVPDYSYYDKKQGSDRNRRCIDGSITGCGKCVGYCQYPEHSGFLTEEQRKEHDCIGKGCFYYLPKPKAEKPQPKTKDISDEIVKRASEVISGLEGIKIISAEKEIQGGWKLKYVTLTNDYSISAIEKRISSAIGQETTMQKLNCDYDTAVRLIFP